MNGRLDHMKGNDAGHFQAPYSYPLRSFIIDPQQEFLFHRLCKKRFDLVENNMQQSLPNRLGKKELGGGGGLFLE